MPARSPANLSGRCVCVLYVVPPTLPARATFAYDQRMKWAAVVAGASLLVGCGDRGATSLADADADPDVDAPPPGPCWDPAAAMPMGQATLGTGWGQFEPMPTDLPLEYGSQAGFNVVVNVQMRGFVPGNPNDVFDPTNPRTRILSYFADDGRPLNKTANCPYRKGYRAVDANTYEMGTGVPLIFDTCWRAEHLIGRQLRIKLELLDSTNGFTTDERVVTMVEPAEWYPSGEGLPPCPP